MKVELYSKAMKQGGARLVPEEKGWEMLELVRGACKLAHRGPAMPSGQHERETLPAATARLALVLEYSHMFCQEDNHNPPSRALSQIKNYRVKLNSPNVFFHSLLMGLY